MENIFDTEREIAEYIIKQIAEKMAHYRHFDKMAVLHAKNSKPPNKGLD